ncbi:TPA: alpha/beta fold hydrolase [Legionella pneumophila subsp. pneumophila]|nr:alpha/beta fold hydrolase [Legionella pneumophila subsp. pneumophila]HAT9650865.1 alpha/beta fold hydrolase [Legionella pneumophila subsp. pneumophila]HAT9921690.1 alpha/beta fold hydrolase [Legionella pneumophila subsp. pneumophila]
MTMNNEYSMKINDFRYMRRGKHLSELQSEEANLLAPVNQRGKGTDRALLVLHGFSSSPAVYRYLIPNLKNYDAILCPVLAGHAESIEAFSKSTAADWLQSAKNACELLINQYQKVDVLGLSLGGLLACQLSQSFAINHLFLLAPALKLHMRTNAMLKLAQILKCLGFRQLRNAAGNLITDEHAEIAYRKLPISTIIEMLTLAQQYEWLPPACPADLFLGIHDQVVASQQVEQLFCNLPNVKIHWLKNSAHVLPLDNDLNEIIDCINKSK